MLRTRRTNELERERVKRDALERAAAIKAKRAAVAVIERFWAKHEWRLELRKAREYLRRLPHDCRVLWVKLNCAKAQVSDLKEEIDGLINRRLASD